MSDAKDKTKPEKPKEESGTQVIQVPESRQKRIFMLNAEIASLNARLHEHLAIICEDNAVDVGAGAMFGPDFKTVIINNGAPSVPPKLEPE